MLKYFSLFFISLFFPFAAFAAETSLDPCIANPELTMCTSAKLPIGGALGSVIQFLFVIAVVLALGFLVFGGIKWITSGGDKGGVEAARNMIIAAIIGLIIVFVAYVVLNLILIFLTGSGIGGIKIPTLGGTTQSSSSGNTNTSCGNSGQNPCTVLSGGEIVAINETRGYCNNGAQPNPPAFNGQVICP